MATSSYRHQFNSIDRGIELDTTFLRLIDPRCRILRWSAFKYGELIRLKSFIRLSCSVGQLLSRPDISNHRVGCSKNSLRFSGLIALRPLVRYSDSG